MVCKYCGAKLGVTDTTHIKETNDIYRSKKCPKCGSKFYTVEKMVEPDNNFWFYWHENSRYTRKNRR